LLLVIVAALGCSDDSTGPEIPEIPPSAITAEAVIITPKSPQPGDTVQVTAVVTSSHTNPGNPTSYSWSASAGTFIETNQQSVRWIAPSTSSVDRISVTAKNSVNSSSAQVDVFTGSATPVLSQEAGELHLLPNETDFYYLSSPYNIDSAQFRGFTVWRSVGGSQSEVTPGESGNRDYTFSTNLAYAAALRDEPPLFGSNLIDPINVFLDDLNAGIRTRVTDDEASPSNGQKTRMVSQDISPDESWLVYERYAAAFSRFDPDTIDVRTYNIASQQHHNITETHGILRHCYYPSFSSDGEWVTYISDYDGINKWELWGLKFNNGVPDTALTDAVRLTSTGGLITSGQPRFELRDPRKVWNPNPADPILALVSQDGILRLIRTTGTGATMATVDGLVAGPGTFFWSNDGQQLAVISAASIYTVPKVGGQATLVHESPDPVSDVAWAPDASYLVYRVSRGILNWIELIPINATGLLSSLVVTPAEPKGSLDNYVSAFDTKPVVTTTGSVYILSFVTTTPSLSALDVSSISP